jgi:hypothetical protein
MYGCVIYTEIVWLFLILYNDNILATDITKSEWVNILINFVVASSKHSPTEAQEYTQPRFEPGNTR